jgi:hypothetical protein
VRNQSSYNSLREIRPSCSDLNLPRLRFRVLRNGDFENTVLLPRLDALGVDGVGKNEPAVKAPGAALTPGVQQRLTGLKVAALAGQ